MITETPDYIPCKPCEYKGVNYRSKLEALWAEFLDEQGLGFEYEKRTFDLGNHLWYLPDFWIPKREHFLEVKGVMDNLSLKKVVRFALLNPKQLFLGFSNVGVISRVEHLYAEAWWEEVCIIEPRLKKLELTIKKEVQELIRKRYCTEAVHHFYGGWRKEGSLKWQTAQLVGFGSKKDLFHNSPIYDLVIDYLMNLYPSCCCFNCNYVKATEHIENCGAKGHKLSSCLPDRLLLKE